MNPAALFMSVYDFTWEGLLAIYISGIPVDLVHASSTFIFLWIGAKPLLEKLQRIKIKYDLMRRIAGTFLNFRKIARMMGHF